MTLQLALTSTTYNSVTLAITGLSSANGATMDLQFATNPDFEFCVCPIVFGLTQASSQPAGQLNQQTNYWVRGRNRLSDGTVDDWSNVLPFRTLDAASRNLAPASVVAANALIVKPIKVVNIIPRTEYTGYPTANAFRDGPSTWQSLGDQNNNHYVDLFLGGQTFDTVAILNTNAPEAATVSLQTYATASPSAGQLAALYTGPFRATPNLPGRRGYHSLIRLNAPCSTPYLRIIINGIPPGGMLSVGYIVLGLNKASKNAALGKKEAGLPLGTLERKRSGVPDRVTGLAMRRIQFEIDNMTEAQYESLYHEFIYEQNNTALVVPNTLAGPYLHDRILYGDLSGGEVDWPGSAIFTRSFTIDSLI